MKEKIKKIFKPQKIIGFLIFNLSFVLLIYVFARHLEDTFLAYVAYLLSTYALILFIIWFWKACRFSNYFIKSTKIYQLYKKHFNTVWQSTLFVSTILNVGYCIFNLVVGVYYGSFWFITFAVYYFGFSVMRLSLLFNVKNLGKNFIQEYQKLKKCGIVLLLLNIVLVGIIILILHNKSNIHYSGMVIYIVALYDFYLIISAFINIFKYRNSISPVLLANRAIKVVVAMLAIISLEEAMITEFGNDVHFKVLMIGLTGAVVWLINSILAIYLIWKASRHGRM